VEVHRFYLDRLLKEKKKALKFAYRDRRQRKEIYVAWITRINAAARVYNLNYSQFIYKFKQLNIHVNRKWLAQFAVRDSKCSTNLFKWSSKHYL
jgi:large subunit ribosomal protein L20